MKALVSLVVLVLTGCGAALEVIGTTPRSISVCYHPVLGSQSEAARVAEDHCQAEGGRHAERLAGSSQCGTRIELSYRCVP